MSAHEGGRSLAGAESFFFPFFFLLGGEVWGRGEEGPSGGCAPSAQFSGVLHFEG